MSDQASQLRDIVSQIPVSEKKEQQAQIITVTSGKGGVGKTSISVNLSIALAQMNKRVVLIDADFGLANVDVLLGISAKYDLSHVLRGEKTVSEVISSGHGGIRFISGGAGVLDLLSTHTKSMSGVIEQICALGDDADFVIFDTGAGINADILKMISISDHTLLVMTPEPTSIVDAFALIKSMSSKGEKQKVSLIINKSDSILEAASTANNFKRVVARHLSYPLDVIGFIYNDKVVPKAIKMQSPFLLSFPTSTAAQSVKTIAARFIDIKIATKGGLRGFFEKMSGRR